MTEHEKPPMLIPRPSLDPSFDEVKALFERLKGTGYVLIPVSEEVRAKLDNLALDMNAADFSEVIRELVEFWLWKRDA